MKIHTGWASFWAAILVALGVLDYALDQRDDGSTFSEGTRWLFRVDTATGRASFLAALFGGAGIFALHILKKEARS